MLLVSEALHGVKRCRCSTNVNLVVALESRVTTINPLGTRFHGSSYSRCQSDDGATGKIRGSPKSQGSMNDLLNQQFYHKKWRKFLSLLRRFKGFKFQGIDVIISMFMQLSMKM